MTNKDYYNWHIIEKDKQNTSKEIKWICQCKLCGKIKSVRGTDIRKGKSTNCGCEKIKKLIQRNKQNALDLTGQIFGYLKCLYPTEERQGGDHIIWMCKCLKCGNEHKVSTSDLKKGSVISCGCKKTSIGEFFIRKILNENNITFEEQKQFETCIYPDSLKKPKFDFFVNNEYIIEYDGIQHFYTSKNSYITESKLNRTKEQDEYKNTWCFNNNIPIIRIPFTLKPNQIKINDLILEKSNFILTKKGEINE